MSPEWIAVDWGTTSCRAWAIARDGAVIAEARSNQGMGQLTRDAYEGVLIGMIGSWGPAPVVACGMVGSRQGWVEAGYVPVPCTPDQFNSVAAPVNTPGLHVTVVGGVKQINPPDVMRGEETQIAGYLASNPDFDGVLCLPGTHTKWVQISAGELVSFRTAMTGEIFAFLAKGSVLRHAMGTGWDDDAFQAAVSDALSRPEALAARLFSIRAESLLDGLAGNAARARVSGMMIGAELAAMRPYWLGQNVAIIGETELAQIYASALAAQGLAPRVASGDEMTRAGLGRLRKQLEEL